MCFFQPVFSSDMLDVSFSEQFQKISFSDPLPSGITMVAELLQYQYLFTSFTRGASKYLSNGFRWATNDTLGYVHIYIYISLFIDVYFLDKCI